MMDSSSGIGGGSKPIQPSESKGPEETSGEPTGKSLENALHAPVKTLGQLKQVLIDNLGEKEGKKLYNSFMKSFMMQILNQVQESAQQAKKAAQSMRESTQR